MKKIIILGVSFVCCMASHVLAGQKLGENSSKTYTNDDGSSYSVSLYFPKNYYATTSGSGYNIEHNSIGGTHHTLNIIAYNKEGEVIGENYYYTWRVTYVADENDNIVGIKSCWTCPMIETFQYTDSDKILVYGTDGKLKGTYDSLLDYHVTNPLGQDSYNGTPNGYAQYIDHSLNLTDEDGNFYDYDQDHKLKGIYYANGTKKSYVYDANGDYKIYDQDGNFFGSFMSDGTKRRIYSVEEATAVAQKGSKNKFIIQYR